MPTLERKVSFSLKSLTRRTPQFFSSPSPNKTLRATHSFHSAIAVSDLIAEKSLNFTDVEIDNLNLNDKHNYNVSCESSSKFDAKVEMKQVHGKCARSLTEKARRVLGVDEEGKSYNYQRGIGIESNVAKLIMKRERRFSLARLSRRKSALV